MKLSQAQKSILIRMNRGERILTNNFGVPSAYLTQNPSTVRWPTFVTLRALELIDVESQDSRTIIYRITDKGREAIQ